MSTHSPVCHSVHAAMDVLGKPWTGLILSTLSGAQMGFCELAEKLGSIGDRMLSVRLKELEKRGMIERLVVSQTPFRVAYRLTELGGGFMDVQAAMGVWGAQILAHAAAQPQETPR